jgi:hypothetical protein
MTIRPIPYSVNWIGIRISDILLADDERSNNRINSYLDRTELAICGGMFHLLNWFCFFTWSKRKFLMVRRGGRS